MWCSVKKQLTSQREIANIFYQRIIPSMQNTVPQSPEGGANPAGGKKKMGLIICLALVLVIPAIVVAGFEIKNYFTGPHLGVSSPQEVSQVPFTNSSIQDIVKDANILDFDSIANGDEVDIVYVTDKGSRGYGSYFVSGQPQKNSWSIPIKLPVTGLDAKIVRANGSLHILIPSREKILHITSKDNGNTWRELSPIVIANRFISNYDAISTGENIIIAYTTALQGVGETPIDVNVARWSSLSNTLIVSPTTLASFESIYTTSPIRLSLERNNIYLVYGENDNKASGHIFFTKSTIEDSRWLTPVDVSSTGGDSISGKENRGISILDADALNLLVAENKVYVFYSEGGQTFSTNSSNGVNWSPAISLYPYVSQADKNTFAVASSGSSTKIAWIDGRFELVTPQFGIPWSDNNPYWGNNDIFTATISDSNGYLQELKHNSLKDGLAIYRITKPVSFSRSVAIRSMGNNFIVIWSGVAGLSTTDKNDFNSKKYLSGIFYTFF